MIKIQEGRLYLPAIQRKFVWAHNQIERLFDSIMRDYPIGTFLFWIVKPERFDEYAFYQFIKDYHELNNWKNKTAGKPHLSEELIGVLDGQQRLNSMYVALQGTYAYKLPRRHRTNPSAYPVRQFYLNVFKPEEELEDDDVMYEFKFLTEAESKIANEKVCWYPIRNLLTCSEAADVTDIWDDFKEERLNQVHVDKETSRRARNILTNLWQRMTRTPLINYFPVESQRLDEVLDIFVRVNSAGKPLSKTDLLFSTIVAHWEEGRDKIEEFLEDINHRGNGFNFDTDFMMRTCLVLADCPVRLRVASFKKENVRRIVDSWGKITDAMESTVELLVEWGFQSETLTAANAVIPIAYAIKNGCDISASKVDLRLYLIKSLLTGVYSGHGDQLLADIRKYLEDALKKSALFSVDNFETTAKLPSGKSIIIDKQIFDDLLMSEKGPRTFMLLSFLYPHLKFHTTQFHQDHIHPHSGFSKVKLKQLGLTEEQINDWQDKRDCLPNLQLMEGKENQSKNKKPFADWLKESQPNLNDQKLFLNANHIPDDASLDLKGFEIFFEKRKAKLKEKLEIILNVATQSGSKTEPTLA